MATLRTKNRPPREDVGPLLDALAGRVQAAEQQSSSRDRQRDDRGTAGAGAALHRRTTSPRRRAEPASSSGHGRHGRPNGPR